MFHGDITPDIAKGIQVLRARIEAAKVPPSLLDESLNIATWNIRALGHGRERAAIHYIAEILSQFDLIAITEVRAELTDLGRVLDILGPYWRVVYSDYIQDHGGNWERIAYVYDKRAVVFNGLASEADPLRRKTDNGEWVSDISWWRAPYMASFRSGNFDFTVLSVHIRWGDNEEDRIAPLGMLAEWVNKRRKSKHVADKDFIVMGDFNIPEIDHDLFEAVSKHGLRIPKGLLGMDHGSNLAKDKRYDQILCYPSTAKRFVDIGGVIDFYAGDYRKLFPAELYPDMSVEKFTFQLSDHLPLWTQIDTWIEDEQLEQIIQQGDQ